MKLLEKKDGQIFLYLNKVKTATATINLTFHVIQSKKKRQSDDGLSCELTNKSTKRFFFYSRNEDTESYYEI